MRRSRGTGNSGARLRMSPQYQLAVCYRDGLGTARDGQLAANWLAKAAESGHSEAQFRLGRLLSRKRPDGLLQWSSSMKGPVQSPSASDVTTSFRLFFEAAQNRHRIAQFYVGTCY